MINLNENLVLHQVCLFGLDILIILCILKLPFPLLMNFSLRSRKKYYNVVVNSGEEKHNIKTWHMEGFNSNFEKMWSSIDFRITKIMIFYALEIDFWKQNNWQKLYFTLWISACFDAVKMLNTNKTSFSKNQKSLTTVERDATMMSWE